MKFRDAVYVAGGYVVHDDKVLLVWHPQLARWVPAGGRVEIASGEYPHEAVVREVQEETGLVVDVIESSAGHVSDKAVTPMPVPIAIQEIALGSDRQYLDFVYFCRVVEGEVGLDYIEARAYKWFAQSDLYRFPLFPHVRRFSELALQLAGTA
jgi:ADP-ribose pyrophosphatase YjhB (NUDIX family)